MLNIVLLLCILSLPVSMFIHGMKHGQQDALDTWETKIHNAAATGVEITVDGTRYRVYREVEPKQLQAMRSKYARRCQAITDKFFNEEFKQ